MTTASSTRRYDLDSLRIAAFALLILYHIGMVFVPWGFHIKTAHVQDWLEPVMLMSNAWRLALLFLISGVASRAMLNKGLAPGGFARVRTARLLVPLLAGVALWVVPQAWVDVTVNHGYRGGFWHFWAQDYFRFDDGLGLILPTWNHLWFVAYLWVYTLLLAAGLALPAGARAALQRGFDRLFGGWRLLVLPVLYIALVRIALADRFPESHALADDWCAHLVYGGAFAFGVGLGPASPLWAGIARWWKPCLAASVLGWAVVAGAQPFDPQGWALAGVRAARAVQAWGTILGLLGLAEAHWQRDHRWRAPLSEAVFPAYIAHQTILIVVMFWLLPMGLPPGAEFALLLLATVAGCAVFYLGGRRIGWLRPLIGLQASATPSWASSQALRSTPPA